MSSMHLQSVLTLNRQYNVWNVAFWWHLSNNYTYSFLSYSHVLKTATVLDRENISSFSFTVSVISSASGVCN